MNKNKAIVPRLKRDQIIRLGRLLNMEYRPAELAKILKVNVDTVRRNYLIAGCPHRRDMNGHIWINGSAFRVWATELLASKKKKNEPMLENEGWCFKCNARVEMKRAKIINVNRFIEMMQSTCECCGTRVNRARSRAKK